MDAEIVSTVFEVATRTKMTGAVIARGVRYEDFLRDYSGQHVEWVQGYVIKMSPVSAEHNAITRFLIVLFDNLLSEVGGQVFHDPMVMRLGPGQPARQPDIQILLEDSLHRVQKNSIEGPADLIVEVVSTESQHRDHFEKRQEYEAGGVREYWVIDPLRRNAVFYALNDEDVYDFLPPDDDGVFQSHVMPDLRLPVDIFWRETLPKGLEIARIVEAMLNRSA